ncbi:GlcG/HbpS family heme-binding protein [Geomonas sp.]|uniref:GlcG/HbpS family heme-binding protein n=1 Tax=Geomonas sp. TaxID=2651584 RepID=UPI002B46D8A8|nr:heme-binding protein [Geomonas sp.]HJV35846.1 heme-binding protein [Geomonas sp.]
MATGVILMALGTAGTASADSRDNGCEKLPGYASLKAALIAARSASNGGFNLDMWGAIVNRDGIVCAVAFTGSERGSQWPGSRVIAAQKANTANAFSLPGLALSSANLWAPVQPGGSLYGLQASNPVDTATSYKGPSRDYGTGFDPLIGNKIGGINVFGGGLALYNRQHELVGGLGVSGDTSCADHNIAWRTRNNLHLDYVPAGVSGDAARPDNINYQGIAATDTLANDFSHPICKIAGDDKVSAISANLPPIPEPTRSEKAGQSQKVGRASDQEILQTVKNRLP